MLFLRLASNSRCRWRRGWRTLRHVQPGRFDTANCRDRTGCLIFRPVQRFGNEWLYAQVGLGGWCGPKGREMNRVVSRFMGGPLLMNLGVRDRVQLVVLAYERGLIHPGDTR